MFFSQKNGDENPAQYSRSFKSPIFSFSNSATISAGDTFLFDYHRDNQATEKYGSFNNLRIFNGSTSLVIVYPNQDKNQGIPVASGTDIILDESSVPSTTSLLVENADGSNSITSNQVRVQIWRDKVEVKSIASRLHKRFFGEELKETFLNQTKKGSAI